MMGLSTRHSYSSAVSMKNYEDTLPQGEEEKVGAARLNNNKG
jgi:hypothetical protein